MISVVESAHPDIGDIAIWAPIDRARYTYCDCVDEIVAAVAAVLISVEEGRNLWYHSVVPCGVGGFGRCDFGVDASKVGVEMQWD